MPSIIPVKIKSRRGRPSSVTTQRSSGCKSLRGSFSRGQSRGSSLILDSLVEKGFLSFDEKQAIGRFAHLYRSYLCILKIPGLARSRSVGGGKGDFSSCQEEFISEMWQKSLQVLHPYGLTGEKLLKSVCQEKITFYREKDLILIRDMAQKLSQLYAKG